MSQVETVATSPAGGLYRTRPATWASDLPAGSAVVEWWDGRRFQPFAWLINGRVRPWDSSRVGIDVERDAMAVFHA